MQGLPDESGVSQNGGKEGVHLLYPVQRSFIHECQALALDEAVL